MRPKLAFLFVCTAFIGANCPGPAPAPPPPVVVIPDAAVEAEAPPPGPSGVPKDDCERAERYAETKSCPLPKPKNGTWTQACLDGNDNGFDMQEDCVLLSKDCAAIQVCMSAPPR